MTDQYQWWRKALQTGGGRELTREQMDALGVPNEPQSGFYRRRAYKDGPFVPVAIWRDGAGNLVCVQDGKAKEIDDFLWSFSARWPIEEKLYRAVSGGAPWPDEPPAPPKDHNQVKTGDPHTDLLAEFAAEAELAEGFLRKPITTQEQADQAAIWSKRVAAIAKKATDLHKVEKQPSLDEGRRIDDKWRDLKEKPADLAKRLKRHMDAFLQEQDRIERERQRKAAEEAERIRREADAKAAEAARLAREQEEAGKGPVGLFADEVQKEADRLAEDAARAAREAEARNATAGRTGAKVALRTFVSARVTDYEAAALALLKANHREIRDVIDQLANRAVKAGIDLAGVERVEERRAA